MNTTRRMFSAGMAETLAAAGIMLLTPTQGRAYLLGRWWLVCPHCGQRDRVTGGTEQHECENCREQVFSGTKVTIECYQCKHHNKNVDTVGERRSLTCSACKQECREPEPQSSPYRDRDVGGK